MSKLEELAALVARLRGPGGCPWDQAQTLRSVRPYLLEEAYEVLDAVDRHDAGGPAGAVRDEVGDLLFVVLLLCRIAEEDGLFSVEDAAEHVAAKMVRRHPHVFGDAAVTGGTNAAWEAAKAAEKAEAGEAIRETSALDGVPRSLPALLRAWRQGEKASAVGFDWADPQGVLAKVAEELGELQEALAESDPATHGAERPHDPAVFHEYGDVLLALASLGRFLGASPEEALRAANDRFAARFSEVERMARARGVPMPGADDATLDALWEEAKARLG